jgi:hypothetical protein
MCATAQTVAIQQSLIGVVRQSTLEAKISLVRI